MEEGGPPLLIPRLEVDGGLAEEELHHLLRATPGSLHQQGVAVPVLGVGVDTLGQAVLDAAQVALSARPVELGLAQGTNVIILVREDYLLPISNLLTLFGFRSFQFHPTVSAGGMEDITRQEKSPRAFIPTSPSLRSSGRQHPVGRIYRAAARRCPGTPTSVCWRGRDGDAGAEDDIFTGNSTHLDYW